MNVINRAVADPDAPRPTLAASAQEPATTSTLFIRLRAPLAALPVHRLAARLAALRGFVIGSFPCLTLIMLLLMFALRDVAVTFVMGGSRGPGVAPWAGRATKPPR
jgi:hypothetical protein